MSLDTRMSKTKRVVFAVLWGLLAGASGFLILIIQGLHDAFSGSGPLMNLPFMTLIGLFAVSLVSSLAEVWTMRGEDSSTKARMAMVFAALPPIGLAFLIVSIILFAIA